MRPWNSRSLSSWFGSAVVAACLIAGSTAFAQNHGVGGGHGGVSGRAAGLPSRGFSGSITGFPGQISTPGSHAIAVPGRAVFPASSHAFVPGFIPQSAPTFQPAWRGRQDWQGRGHDGGHNGDRGADHDRGHNRGYRRGGYGYAGGYPIYASSWNLLPYDAGSDFTDDETGESAAQQDNQPAVTVPPPDNGYRPQYPGYEEPYPAQQAYAPPAVPAAPIAPEPELTLIFKDGHTQPIHNYVLTASDVVVLDEAASGRQQRIPLSDLDLSATEKAAQQAGLDFSPPA